MIGIRDKVIEILNEYEDGKLPDEFDPSFCQDIMEIIDQDKFLSQRQIDAVENVYRTWVELPTLIREDSFDFDY